MENWAWEAFKKRHADSDGPPGGVPVASARAASRRLIAPATQDVEEGSRSLLVFLLNAFQLEAKSSKSGVVLYLASW
ncbi:hypothetical protein EVAR_32157_1 [Eumeta japonica]|uniref:Uncharacterized protein n=1 Tax=Eumeta variegata TaxID=151549 RepID=A0A4C1VXP2_EUMVA|nr:hypothetical protein EVAR_32157_1 [Eumeta japonica]